VYRREKCSLPIYIRAAISYKSKSANFGHRCFSLVAHHGPSGSAEIIDRLLANRPGRVGSPFLKQLYLPKENRISELGCKARKGRRQSALLPAIPFRFQIWSFWHIRRSCGMKDTGKLTCLKLRVPSYLWYYPLNRKKMRSLVRGLRFDEVMNPQCRSRTSGRYAGRVPFFSASNRPFSREIPVFVWMRLSKKFYHSPLNIIQLFCDLVTKFYFLRTMRCNLLMHKLFWKIKKILVYNPPSITNPNNRSVIEKYSFLIIIFYWNRKVAKIIEQIENGWNVVFWPFGWRWRGPYKGILKVNQQK
jgi:hypothetical protein